MKQRRGIALYEELNKGDIFSLNGLKPEQLAKIIASKYGVNPADFVTGKGGTIVYNPKRHTNQKSPTTTNTNSFGAQANEDNRNLMKATPQWMAQKYDEMNSWLFNGALGDCKFEIFTTGKGSQGRTLGWFCINANNGTLRCDRRTRKMYMDNWGSKVFITKENFVKFCHPTIKLNGNYSGTEQALLSTLVHEMCHYYTYMQGWAPTQAHGTEFRNIADVVSSRSNGLFTVQRLATAEEMTEYELDPEIQQKNQKRLENKKSKITLVVVYLKNGEIRLINAANQNVVDTIKSIHNKRHNAQYILTSNDSQLLDLVFNTGFKSSMRTYRYWTINDKPELLRILNNKDNFDIDETPYL